MYHLSRGTAYDQIKRYELSRDVNSAWSFDRIELGNQREGRTESILSFEYLT